jgi:hypothetical protein
VCVCNIISITKHNNVLVKLRFDVTAALIVNSIPFRCDVMSGREHDVTCLLEVTSCGRLVEYMTSRFFLK